MFVRKKKETSGPTNEERLEAVWIYKTIADPPPAIVHDGGVPVTYVLTACDDTAIVEDDGITLGSNRLYLIAILELMKSDDLVEFYDPFDRDREITLENMDDDAFVRPTRVDWDAVAERNTA
jgi:hypothetical protein